jgi:flagellar protein FlaG
LENIIMNIGALGGAAPIKQRDLEPQPSPVTPQANAVKAAPAQTKDTKQPDATPSVDEVKQAVRDINQSFKALSRGLEFTVDEDSNRTIVKVVDQETQEVIRQLPSKETLEIAKALDQMVGKLIREKA